MTTVVAPREAYPKLFLRFLRLGLLAFGGPVAQIAMIRQELVEQEEWETPERFNRVLAVYQVLPGPEATELAVHFGMLAAGRMGGVLAGLGFVLPGFLLMFALSWFYVAVGINSPDFAAAFRGAQPAVAALIVRAIHRIGTHALRNDRWLWALALGAGAAQLLNIHFLFSLGAAGLLYALAQRQHQRLALALGLVCAAMLIVSVASPVLQSGTAIAGTDPSAPGSSPAPLALLISGLRAGLLTFGGAYTAIPFVRHDAVEVGGWMTNAQFLDGLALSGILPAPLIIFSTFVGYLGGGPLGAVLMTAGVFLPAFGLTLVGHQYMERLVANQATHAFLDGVTAGVVGLIGATALGILSDTVTGVPAWIIFALATLTLFRGKAQWAVAVVVVAAGLAGWLFYR